MLIDKFKKVFVTVEITRSDICAYSNDDINDSLYEYFEMLYGGDNFYVSDFLSVCNINGITITSGDFICEIYQKLYLASVIISYI